MTESKIPTLAVEVTKWRRDKRGTRVAFVSLLLPEIALSIRDVAVHRFTEGNTDRLWISMPSRTYTDNEGRAQSFALFWFSRPVHEQIADAVFDRLKTIAPDMLATKQQEECAA